MQNGSNIKDKRKNAIAISYDTEDAAPQIIASGRGYIAERIIEKAKDAEVPLYKDDKLANTLMKLDVGDYIPQELYNVVAEILIFVDKTDRLKGKIYGE